ncbi:MAG: DUF2304 domain-containing protein [Bacillota bacterium]|nr:DUF2304 domain-containing protein [Bacillota bacterium]
MNNMLQIFLLGCTLLFATVVISLLLKNKISERYSVIWLGGAMLIFLISGNLRIVDITAKWLGIAYPPSLLFLFSNLVLLLFSLYQTIQITKLSNKIRDISQYLALEEQHRGKGQIQVGKEHEYNNE